MSRPPGRGPNEPSSRVFWLLACGLSVVFAALDLALPLGVAAGIPYVAVVLTSWYIGDDDRPVLLFAGGSTVLTLLGWVFSPAGGIPWVVAANRVFAVAAVWVVTGFVLLQNRTRRSLARAEAQRDEYVQELDHRVKNVLAQVQALSDLTAAGAGDLATYQERFGPRIGAMSRVHELLATRRWESAPIGQLLEQVLEPHRAVDRRRFSLQGDPDLVLPGRLVTPLAQALNELATNALKHGALRVPEGRVAIAWSTDEAHETLSLSWRESGGPPVEPPSRTGLGQVLTDSALTQALGAQVESRYEASGLVWELALPLAGVDGLAGS